MPADPAVPASRRIAARLAGVRSSPVRDLLALADRPEIISFAGGLPAPELFDLNGFRDAFGQALAAAPGPGNLQYAATEGNPRLRQQVADRLTGRGVPTGASDVLITSGSQQALTLITTALLDPGGVVAVESPTYLAALQAFRLADARVVPVPGDDDGLDPDALQATIREHRPTLLYLVPTFANPTGRTMSRARRQAVVDIAAAHGLWVIEDDPYGELRYDGPAVPLMAGLPDARECVLHLGSFSKIGAPGLRLGWVRAPQSLRPSLVVAKQAADLHSSTIDQAAAAIYLDTGALDEHVTGLRRVYGQRRDAMLARLPGALPAGAAWTRPAGRRHVRLDHPARRPGRGRRSAGRPGRWGRLRPGCRVLRRRPRSRHPAPVVHHPRTGGDRGGSGPAGRRSAQPLLRGRDWRSGRRGTGCWCPTPPTTASPWAGSGRPSTASPTWRAGSLRRPPISDSPGRWSANSTRPGWPSWSAGCRRRCGCCTCTSVTG
ncbi:MAG: PLP-dependent aminotransferase family protein [Nakamurella multipartita]